MLIAVLGGARSELRSGVDWRRKGRGRRGPLGEPVVLQRAGCRSELCGGDGGLKEGNGPQGGS